MNGLETLLLSTVGYSRCLQAVPGPAYVHLGGFYDER